MHFVHKTRKIAGVEESNLTVFAQISMLNHANHLEVAKAPPPTKAKSAGDYKAFKGYTELEKVAIKARGVELLNLFLVAPEGKRIPLSNGLRNVALGIAEDVAENASEGVSEGDHLEPMPLPGVLDTFDFEGETFE